MKRSPVLLLVLLALLPAATPGHAQSLPPTAIFQRSAAPLRPDAARASVSVPGGLSVTVDREALRGFRSASGGRLDLPLANGSSLTLALTRFEVLAPGATVSATGAAGAIPIHPDLVLFRGPVEGEPGSLAVLAMTPDEVTGWIERRDGHLLIAPGGAGAAAGGHVIADEAALPPPGPFLCPSDDLVGDAPPTPPGLALLPQDVQATTTRLVCGLALELDYEFFVKEGSDATRATNYALTLLGISSSIYEREINVALEATYLNVWTTVSDPYSATDLNSAITEFRTWWIANRDGVSRSVAQLVSGRALGGGIAYVGALCSTIYGYSVIANLNGSNVYPLGVTTWDVNVMAHELGHNFSSNHTHSCWWQSHGYAPAGALLDSCYTPEGTCASGWVAHVPPDLGTIMSYCHLLGGEGSIRLDFHPACRTVMRNAAEAAACLPAATVQPPSALSVTPGAAGAGLAWSASPTSGVLRYDVYRSPWPEDLAPTRIGSTTGTSFADLAIGTYWYKVRAARSADSSGFSGEVRSLVCAPSAPATHAAGVWPIGCLSADFDEDGILDLAVAEFSGQAVSILRGLGTGGVGNGSFAAASHFSVPAASYPAGLACADFNGDGILDLAAACEEASSVTLLFGQGTGGVGNGSFTLGPSLAVGASPWAVVTGDFNADGIPDLAAACGSGAASVLIGHGTDGVPDGTFASAVNYPVGAVAYGIATGDFDSNGILDLAVAAGTGVCVFPGQGTGGRGDGTFGTRTTYACQTSPQAVATGDFNADGITDLAVANSGTGSVSVLLGRGSAGQGDGTFAAAVNYPSGDSPYAVMVGDWNGDGVPDLVVPNGAAGTLSILPGRATAGVADGTFGPPQAFAAGTEPRALGLGDFDADGVADFAVVNNSDPGTVSTLLASCDDPLPATLRVHAPAGRVSWVTQTQQTLAWSRAAGVLSVDVALSRDSGANWQTIARAVTDTTWTWNVVGPFTEHARIRVLDPAIPGHAALCDSEFVIIPAALLDAPRPGPPRLALQAIRPNPARARAEVWFTLEDDGPARLEVLDLAGRRVRSLEAGAGPGRHHVELDCARSLGPGLYLVRLTQAGRAVTRKLVVTR
jgi:hypothetical protein